MIHVRVKVAKFTLGPGHTGGVLKFPFSKDENCLQNLVFSVSVSKGKTAKVWVLKSFCRLLGYALLWRRGLRGRPGVSFIKFNVGRYC